MELLLGAFSFEKILALPLMVSGPGLLIIFLFLIRFIRSLFSLHLVTAFTSLVYAFVIAVILSNAGQVIVQMLGIEDDPETSSFLQYRLDHGHQSLAQLDGVVRIKMNTV